MTAETAPRPTPTQWLAGARPRTLPAACSPVIAGTGLAVFEQGASWVAAVLALVVSLALQVGVNYANDYSDGIRGTDTERVGPQRLVGSGLASPPLVKRAAFVSFGIACLAGLALVIMTQYWWLLAVGVACRAGRLVLHRWKTPLRICRSGRGLRLRLLWTGGSLRHRVRASGQGFIRHAAHRRMGRRLGVRDLGGQQPARHRGRSAGRQANRGNPAWGRQDAGAGT